MSTNRITIIVPVYADWPSLKDCIESLKIHTQDSLVESILLVNDAGPEADQLEENIKALIKDEPRFKYYRNPKNLGFVGNCNHAVYELEKTDNDIMLLNSDTAVTAGFADEMAAVLATDSKIAAVSPRSNNATICTLPLSAIKDKGIEPAASYQLFQIYNLKFPRFNEVPTAHGFCMLIRRSLVKKYDLFDPAFGRGYGEEVDFCRRLKRHGYKSVLCNRAFVFHFEARSFSLETKSKLLEVNNQILHERYPRI